MPSVPIGGFGTLLHLFKLFMRDKTREIFQSFVYARQNNDDLSSTGHLRIIADTGMSQYLALAKIWHANFWHQTNYALRPCTMEHA